MLLEPQRAAVKPRVLATASGAALPLEDEIRQLPEAGKKGAVQLLGPAGSGKTTALRHLAAVLPTDGALILLDEPRIEQVFDALPERLVVFTATTPEVIPEATSLALAPWGRDELLEYLLASHHAQCGSVMNRLRGVDPRLFGGLPDVWRIVLDQMAADSFVEHPSHALHRYIEAQMPDTDLVERSRSACLTSLTSEEVLTRQPLGRLANAGFAEGLIHLLRHREVQLLLAAERIAADLHGDAACDFLALRLPRELIRSAGREIASDLQAQSHLQDLLAGPPWSHAMAASLLHAAGSTWMPRGVPPPLLAGALLEGAIWCGSVLTKAEMSEADLRRADLRGADLTAARACKIKLHGARLGYAILDGINCTDASLPRADLSQVKAIESCFVGADLRGACLERATLVGAAFREANLASANFRGADLREVLFEKTQLSDTDFSHALLDGARLAGMDLRDALFARAHFNEAILKSCNLECMDLEGCQFAGARLESALLTGCNLRGANFTGARLRAAGLAEIEAENACFRNADLRKVSFHLGTTRSGRVGSPIACEGSRTGFYTDDYEEQYFKAPEEIRKANLCGADLRGARIDGVDFYLVDLRGAVYDFEQEDHFRRCGAILETRVG
jgi:uncharacterized protein YjbI with pentapeptide repeats